MEFIRAKWEDVTALIESRVVYLRIAIGAMTKAEEAVTRQRLVTFFRDHLERDLFAFCARDEKRRHRCDGIFNGLRKAISP